MLIGEVGVVVGSGGGFGSVPKVRRVWFLDGIFGKTTVLVGRVKRRKLQK